MWNILFMQLIGVDYFMMAWNSTSNKYHQGTSVELVNTDQMRL